MAQKRSKKAADDTDLTVRIPTGVPGLDILLDGGLLESGLYLIEGMAGTGKTILSSQICFNQVRRGSKVLFVTLIAESHMKLLQHLRGMSYFDAHAVAKSFMLVSGYDALSSEGLTGFLKFIVRSVRKYRPAFMVVDGFRTARELHESDLALAEFIHQLNAFITGTRCTTLLLAPFSGSEPQPEHTLVDGLIELTHYAAGMRRSREIEVHKMRAAHHMQGRHTFVISGDGISIYPRLEARQIERSGQVSLPTARAAFGVPSFDRIIGGGLMAGSATTILGAPGAGKTLLGLKFLETGIRNRERSLYFGFYETPERLLDKAELVGIPLKAALKSGALQIIWQPPIERSLDELGHALLEAVRTHRTTRLFIDGLEGFRDVTVHPERFTLFMAALVNQLRTLNATTLFSEEIALFAEEITHTAFGVSAIIENMIVLRHVEVHLQLQRLISVIKLRESGYDNTIHEFSISSHGLRVAPSSQSASDLPTAKTKISTKRRGTQGISRRKTSRPEGTGRRRK